MSTELMINVRCNIACEYCYQNSLREAGNALSKDYDMAAIKAALLKENFRFTIFGGEPLLMPKEDLFELFRWGQEHFEDRSKTHGYPSATSIQTNATLITDEHIAAFKKYNVTIGVSIDGPDALNDARWVGDEARTRAATAHSNAMLVKMLQEGIGVALITTIHRLNASRERLPLLLDWFRQLSAAGLRSVNLHFLQSDTDDIRERLALDEDETVDAFLSCARLMSEIPLQMSPFTDMLRLLIGKDKWGTENAPNTASVDCIWLGCDPYTTEAVNAIDGAGNKGNCGHVCQEGPMWQKASQQGFERYLSLYYTPQQYGGCRGCRFFFACKGNCPGATENHDWREKTVHCGTLIRLFQALETVVENELKQVPLSLSPQRLVVEQQMVETWKRGQRTSIATILAAIQQGELAKAESSGNRPHIDTPHLDHYDAASRNISGVEGMVQWAL